MPDPLGTRGAGADITEPPLPDWLTSIRPHQETAIDEAVELFTSGRKVVMMNAPTGSGKTLIAEVVRRRLHARGLYACTTKTLQDQFLKDFPYAKVLKGRRNYTPTHPPINQLINCDDCTSPGGGGGRCMWCPDKAACPYVVARDTAMVSKLAVVNTAYLLNETNTASSRFSGRDLVIADECDELESSLMGYVEFRTNHYVTEGLHENTGLVIPKKGSHKKTIALWLTDEYMPIAWKLAQQAKVAWENYHNIKDLGISRQMTRTFEEAAFIAEELFEMDGTDEDTEDGATWIRDYKRGRDGEIDHSVLIMKPITVSRYGQDFLWRHGKRWLAMSATIISPDMYAQSLGLKDGEWGVVDVPMTFPKENRPIFAAPVARVVRAEMEAAIPKLIAAIRSICQKPTYRGERVLVHTVSYQLTKEIRRGLHIPGRMVFTYMNANERDEAMRNYARTPGSVLLAPSMDRGYDFKDDLARVVIVAKIPFPYIGDKQVNARMHARDGDAWYQLQAVRSLVQMTGRGVRNEEDWADTWILDAEFTGNLWKKARGMFPAWWKEAVDTEVNVKALMIGQKVA